MRILPALCLLAPIAAAFSQATPPPSISVSGSAEVKAAPDEAVLLVGVETRDEELSEATKQNADSLASALAFLDGQGVQKKHIGIGFIRVEPEFDNDVSRVKPAYFNVRKSLEIRVVDLEKLGPILTGLLTNGINRIDSLDLRASKFRELRDRARALAAAAAREKAAALAAELGVRTGKVLSITDNTPARRMAVSSNIVQNVNDFPETGDGSLALGQIAVAASVSATFEIERD